MTDYTPENTLPNYRSAPRCCNTCKNFMADYEGVGDCLFMQNTYKKMENFDKGIFVFTMVSGTDMCDKWQGREQNDKDI